MFGARPARLPLSIGDPTIVTGATAVTSMFELFGYYLQGGLIDVGFLGAAQIDPQGNINTTVIGPYETPRTRLPGSGGACEIAQNAKSIFVIMRQSPRSFVERLDFRTSVGHRVRVVVTDLGVYHPCRRRAAARRAPSRRGRGTGTRGDGLAAARSRNPWPSRRRPPRPSCGLIREELDPAGVYTR